MCNGSYLSYGALGCPPAQRSEVMGFRGVFWGELCSADGSPEVTSQREVPGISCKHFNLVTFSRKPCLCVAPFLFLTSFVASVSHTLSEP